MHRRLAHNHLNLKALSVHSQLLQDETAALVSTLFDGSRGVHDGLDPAAIFRR
jgi:hypothetical protein